MKKSDKEIEDKLAKLKFKLESEVKIYDTMGQIEMLSGEGTSALKFIYKTKGEIKSLKWALNIK